MAKKSYTAEEREGFAREREGKVEGAKSALHAGLSALVSGEDWSAMLTSIARNVRTKLSPVRYSFANQIIVGHAAARREVDGSAVGTYKAWQAVNRSVRKGAKSVYILAPVPWAREGENAKTGEKETIKGMSFRALPVFLLGQTEGEELPPAPQLPRPVEVDDVPGYAEHVQALRKAALEIEGSPVASFEVRERTAKDHPTAGGWYVPLTRDIVVVDTGNQAQMFKTCVHETAHALMHGAQDHHSYAWHEVEAESVAFIVSSVLGLDTGSYSFPYVATWATQNKSERDATKIVAQSGERIVRAVKRILDALLGAVEDESAVESAEAAMPQAAE